MTSGSQNAFLTDTLAHLAIRDLINPCKYPPQRYIVIRLEFHLFYRSSSCKREVVCANAALCLIVLTVYVMQYEFTNIILYNGIYCCEIPICRENTRAAVAFLNASLCLTVWHVYNPVEYTSLTLHIDLFVKDPYLWSSNCLHKCCSMPDTLTVMQWMSSHETIFLLYMTAKYLQQQKNKACNNAKDCLK